MSEPINAEMINDRARLLQHRLIARLLDSDPGLIGRAKARIIALQQSGRDSPAFEEWLDLLDRPVDEIKRAIVSRHEDMARLRISSPMGNAAGIFVSDEALRRRIRRLAKRGLELARDRQSHPSAQFRSTP